MKLAQKAVVALVIAGGLFGAMGGGSALAVHGHPDKLKKVTLTILITAPTGAEKSWGKVSYKGTLNGTCAIVSCGLRVKKGSAYRFEETAVDVKHHPFLHWVLPSGKTAKGGKLYLKVMAQEAMQAVYKA